MRDTTEKLLSLAAIKVGGNNPWDITVHDPRFYHRVLSQGSLGLGESYMDGWWDCDALDEFFVRILRSHLQDKVRKNRTLIQDILFARLFNLQSRQRAFDIGQKHYNLGNDLFENMLDSRMVYSCGYWKNTNNLDEAQINKMELICQKLLLKPGMRLLDIGCGWGSFVNYAAEKHGVNGVGITVSSEQVEPGRRFCANLPVEIRLQDYRDVNEKFDRVISVGMFEHVGYKNYRTYMETVRRCLYDDGFFLLHTIGGNKSVTSVDPWINKYIFPNGMLPSISQIGKAIEGLFVMEDWHNFSADYDKTLMAWVRNLEKNWDNLKQKYDERFHRMWKYYLLSCAGAFRARGNQLWQVVLSPQGIVGGYKSIR